MKQMTLWSWLTKHETKKEFLCPPELQVSNEDLAKALAQQIQMNRLPAKVDLSEVNWDDTNTKQLRVVVRYMGNDTTTDIVRFLVGVDQMGNFSYVEEKIYLKPPDLPAVPRKKKENNWASSNDLGCLFILLIFVIPFILWAIEEKKVRDWNKEAELEKAAWDAAWEKWQKETLTAAYLAKTDDVFGRFTQAMSSTVEQVLQVLFLDKAAELRRQTATEQTQADIEKELERRKAELFN